MAKRNLPAKQARPEKTAETPAVKPAAKPAAKTTRRKKVILPEILADTAPEEREDVILRVIKGLKKV